MSADAEPEGGLRPAEDAPGRGGARGDGSDQHTAATRRAAAGALVGIAAGGFFVALLAHMRIRTNWSVGAYEPAAALLAALGTWCFGARRGRRDGRLAAGAALAAMLLGDFFWTRAHTPHGTWWQAVVRTFAEFGCRGGHASPGWSVWPKLVRYGFGVYIGWFVGSASSWPTEQSARRKDGE